MVSVVTIDNGGGLLLGKFVVGSGAYSKPLGSARYVPLPDNTRPGCASTAPRRLRATNENKAYEHYGKLTGIHGSGNCKSDAIALFTRKAEAGHTTRPS